MDRRAKPPIARITGTRAVFLPNPKLKLFEQCREVLRFHHYAYRTEQTYLEWIERYIRFCRELPGERAATEAGTSGRWRHPRDCGEAEIKAFLSHLASGRKVSASTQNQALHPVR
jgi:hypothetical protein